MPQRYFVHIIRVANGMLAITMLLINAYMPRYSIPVQAWEAAMGACAAAAVFFIPIATATGMVAYAIACKYKRYARLAGAVTQIAVLVLLWLCSGPATDCAATLHSLFGNVGTMSSIQMLPQGILTIALISCGISTLLVGIGTNSNSEPA